MKKLQLFFLLFFSFSFYGQQDTLSVIRHTENDLVIPKEKKVFFRGIPNELVINVPNCKSFTATGDGLKLIKDNIYSFNPRGGTSTEITIDIVLKNNKKITEKHNFEIRTIKRAITCFNHNKADSILRFPKKSFKNGKVTVISPDINLDLRVKVVGFCLKIPGYKAIAVDGDTIDDKTYQEIIKNSSKGDQIAISDIKVKVITISNVSCFLVNPMLIEVY